MENPALTLVTALCGAAVLYHHLLYPWLLARLARGRRPEGAAAGVAGSVELPTVTLILPARDEAAFVADKLRNLAALDYPPERLRVELVCDGCRDATADIARRTLREPECRELRARVVERRRNRGKVAVINEALARADGELVALSDVSALLPRDALRLATARFADPGVGVVAGGYRLIAAGAGEGRYWEYQRAIKEGEGVLGSLLGVHGAFYLFRRGLFTPLPGDTINDDFLLPAAIVARGYRAVYEPDAAALELERSDPAMDARRRVRIAAGNLQQLIRARALLHPRFGWTAFNFASGKGLRALMPFCLAGLLGGSLLLAPGSPPFALLAAAQLAVYGTAAAGRGPAALRYLVAGHWAGLVGSLRYLLGLERGRWRRAG